MFEVRNASTDKELNESYREAVISLILRHTKISMFSGILGHSGQNLVLRELTLVKQEPPPEVIAQYEASEKWPIFKITEKTIEKLKSDELPNDVRSKLERIKNQKVRGEKFFLDLLKKTIGDNQDEKTVEYISMILEHAEKIRGREMAWQEHAKGLDLRNRDLRFADFTKSDLAKADFRGAQLIGSNFSDANLLGTDFRPLLVQAGESCQGDWEPEDFDEEKKDATGYREIFKEGDKFCLTNLSEVNMYEANLKESKLVHAIMNWAYFRAASLEKMNLKYASLQSANLRKASLQGADLGSASLQGADLRSASLQGAYLGGASLQGAYLGGASLQGANLLSASLQGADLRYASLQGAYLGGASLQGANLWSVSLQGANLWYASLQGANLLSASLQGADLGYASLQGADLRKASLQGVNLGKAHIGMATFSNLKLTDLSNVNCDIPVKDYWERLQNDIVLEVPEGDKKKRQFNV